MLAAKRQDGGLFKSPPYPGYPFIMIPDLTSPYLPNGSLSPTARTVSSFIYNCMCAHTLLAHTHTDSESDAEAAGHGVLSPRSAADENVEPSFATPHEVYSTMACMHACPPAAPEPVRLWWTAASMLTVLSARSQCSEKGQFYGRSCVHDIFFTDLRPEFLF